jgi:hypothetical protein
MCKRRVQTEALHLFAHISVNNPAADKINQGSQAPEDSFLFSFNPRPTTLKCAKQGNVPALTFYICQLSLRV